MKPAHLGLAFDSSVVIAAERQGHTVRQILEQFQTGYGEIEIGLFRFSAPAPAVDRTFSRFRPLPSAI